MTYPIEIPRRISEKLTVEMRSDHVATACWVWNGALNPAGYGMAWDGEATRLAHRVVYLMCVGPIIEESLDHLCMVHACVRPDHLEQVTYQENKIRGMAKRQECKYGHDLDGVRTRPGGVTSRYCKTCQARMQREARARKKVST